MYEGLAFHDHSPAEQETTDVDDEGGGFWR